MEQKFQHNDVMGTFAPTLTLIARVNEKKSKMIIDALSQQLVRTDDGNVDPYLRTTISAIGR